MNFSAWGIRRPLPVVLLFIALTGLGLFGFQKLAITDLPDIELPAVTVTVALAGAAPGQLETEVTRKIEDAIAGSERLKHIRSTVTDGVSTTVANFDIDKPIEVALDDVRDAVSRVRSELPADAEEPLVSRVTTAGQPIVTYAVRSKSLGPEELSWFVDDVVAKALMSQKGVGKVARVGGVDREIRIDLDPARLIAFGVTAGEVSRQLRRVQQEAAGGRAVLGGREQSIRTIGTAADAEALRHFPIVLADGRQLRLSALGNVEDRYADPRQLALVDGETVVSFQVTRSRGSSQVAVARLVQKQVEALAASHPRVLIERVASTVPYLEASYRSSMEMLLEGALLAVAVVWFFLRDWRATWVSAVALPLSVIPTFFVMYTADLTLNTLTLLALSLVVGILVDDAIVEVENIVRHLRMGKSPREAALQAADEIGLAVIATTFTLVAVFAPVAFMPGVPGKFFKQFAVTAVTAVLFSLLVARLLTPMMAARMLRSHDTSPQEGPWTLRYLGWVRWTLAHRARTMTFAALFFVASLSLVPLLPSGFLPTEDRDQTSLNIELPPGVRLEDTHRVAEQARLLIATLPDVVRVYSAIGAAQSGGHGFDGAGQGDVRRATLTITLRHRGDNELSQQQFEARARELLAQIAGARLSFSSGGPGQKLQLVLAGDDPRLLIDAANALEADVRRIPGIGTVTSTAGLLRPELIVRPDPERAASLGVETAAIADAARVATIGDVGFRLAKLNLPSRQVPIRVQLTDDARGRLDVLRELRVPARGGTVPLSAVADIEATSGLAQVDRYDRYRNVTIDAELSGIPLGSALKMVDEFPSMRALPPGVKRINAGDAEAFAELFGGFALAMIAGIFCVYAVLVLLFNDTLQPLTILAALPLSVGGAFGALLAGGYAISVPALIGVLMLMGIVTKNSILLVDYVILARRGGMPRAEALVDACAKRARPILMTTLAMGAGMLPIAFGFSGDSGFRAPMGVAVLGGLVTSTFLSLLVVPAVFTYVDDFGAFVRRIRGKPAVADESA
ncbi:MAG: efflux RND transporter permease subunit [Gammaproteobacteria bacterium]|nr:efflux RND transporter permease subunit [Gammaproteobacteria bacterium]